MNKRWIKIAAVLGVVITAVIFVFILSRRTEPEPAPLPPSTGESYRGIIPGQSGKEEVRETLGNPLEVSDSDLFKYQSNNPNVPHQIYFEDEEVALIKEVLAPEDTKTPEDIVSKYGEAPYVLYGPDSTFGFYLYVYPREGIAYLGHFEEPILLEIWYFTPLSIDDFKDKWASDYSDILTPQQ